MFMYRRIKRTGMAVVIWSHFNDSTLPLNFLTLKHKTYINCHMVFHWNVFSWFFPVIFNVYTTADFGLAVFQNLFGINKSNSLQKLPIRRIFSLSDSSNRLIVFWWRLRCRCCPVVHRSVILLRWDESRQPLTSWAAEVPLTYRQFWQCHQNFVFFWQLCYVYSDFW